MSAEGRAAVGRAAAILARAQARRAEGLPDLSKVFGRAKDHHEHDPAQGWVPLSEREEGEDEH